MKLPSVGDVLIFGVLYFVGISRANYNCPSTPLGGRVLEASSDYKTFDIKETVSVACGGQSAPGSWCNSSANPQNALEAPWSASNKLKVFVIPHSHNDAGWGWTFEDYYDMRTQHILDYMVEFMPKDPDLKLVWAEISFFDRWWRLQTEVTRDKVRRLVENKQLEFVGGGWVMPDEASVHYSSFVTQLLEGHLWLQQRLNYTPTNGWTIDPFGLSPTFSLLSKKSGIKSLTYLRIHYAIKSFLAEQRALEFIWRQFWDTNGRTDVFSHVMPYDSYDTGSTCGPSKLVCAKLGKQMLGEVYFNDSNESELRERSFELVEQLRAKSTLFQTNSIMLPLGGDFRYRTRTEWKEGFPHIKNIMRYVNSQEDLFTEIKIVTLEEYMTAVQEELARLHLTPKTVMGDFFTYDDRNNDYWSGYFTSRIFHKATERKLMAMTRAAQLTYTMLSAEVYKFFGTLEFNFIDDLLTKIIATRRALSLFQHHDGITGTSASSVVVDFAQKLDRAIKMADFVLQQCIFVLSNKQIMQDKLMPKQLDNISNDEEFLEPLLYRNGHNELWSRRAINVNETHPVETISMVNSLPSSTVQLVRLIVTHTQIEVTDIQGNKIPCEIHPTFEITYASKITNLWTHISSKLRKSKPSLDVSKVSYELIFWAELTPLSLKNYRVIYSPESETPVVKSKVYDPESRDIYSDDSRNTTMSKYIQIGNKNLALTFRSDGVLKFATLDGEIIPMQFTFLAYSTKASGLYLFIPTGEAKPVELTAPKIIVSEGEIQSCIVLIYENIIHRFILSHGLGIESKAIEIENIIDIREKYNYELVMRISTDIENEDIFYTDSNGYQMMKRKRLPTNPIQGNYYPVATSAFIEDDKLRLTLLTAQPGGGSSLKSGDFEVMLDRIVNQDDDRGIGQGGTDNLVVSSKVKVLLEKPCSPEKNPEKVPALSLEASHLLNQLLNPVLVYLQTSEKLWKNNDYEFLGSKQIPCDVSLVGTFPLPLYDAKNDSDNNSLSDSYSPGSSFGLVANRISFDERFSHAELQETCDMSSLGNLRVTDLFGPVVEEEVEQMSLTFAKSQGKFNGSDIFKMDPMDIYSFLVSFRSREST